MMYVLHPEEEKNHLIWTDVDADVAVKENTVLVTLKHPINPHCPFCLSL